MPNLMIRLTPRQRQILLRLAGGDLVWEVAGENYFTQFNERTDKQIHIRQPVMLPLESAQLVRRHHQPESAHKLDYWEITEEGLAMVAQSSKPSRKKILRGIGSQRPGTNRHEK